MRKFSSLFPTNTGSPGGWKVYDESQVSVTGTGCVYNYGSFVPYKDPISGIWRLRFNITITYSGGAITTLLLNVAGVTFVNKSQAFSSITGNSSSTPIVVTHARVNTNTNQIFAIFSSTSSVSLYFSGDVELESQPTWADFDGTVNILDTGVLNTSSKMSAYNVATSLTNATTTRLENWGTVDEEGGSNFNSSTGVYTIPEDGFYSIHGAAGINNGNVTFTQFNLSIGDGASATAIATSYGNVRREGDTEAFPALSISRCLYLTKGTTLALYVFQNSGTTYNALTARVTTFSVCRIPTHTSQLPAGFGVAAYGKPGLMKSYFDSGWKNITDTITFSPAPAPTGLVYAKYRWIMKNNEVTVFWLMEYTTAGTSNTSAFFPLPADMPLPSIVTTSSHYCGTGSGSLAISATNSGAGFSHLWFNGSAFSIYTIAITATNTKVVRGQISYPIEA